MTVFDWNAVLQAPLREFTRRDWSIVAPVLLAEFAILFWCAT